MRFFRTLSAPNENGHDAAQTAGVKDSLSKMLVHQLAAAHRSAMELLQQERVNGLPNVDAMRTFGNGGSNDGDVSVGIGNASTNTGGQSTDSGR